MAGRFQGAAFSGVWLVAYAAGFAAASTRLAGALPLEPIVFAIDMGVLCVAIALSVRMPTFWLRWVVALHSLSVAAHVVRLIEPEVPSWAYRIAAYGPGWPILVLIAVGTRGHVLDRRGAANAYSRS